MDKCPYTPCKDFPRCKHAKKDYEKTKERIERIHYYQLKATELKRLKIIILNKLTFFQGDYIKLMKKQYDDFNELLKSTKSEIRKEIDEVEDKLNSLTKKYNKRHGVDENNG